MKKRPSPRETPRRDLSTERVAQWSSRVCAGSLRSILAHREVLLRLAEVTPGEAGPALALARLIDLGTAPSSLGACLEASRLQARDSSIRARLATCRAQLDFERGDLGAASGLLSEARRDLSDEDEWALRIDQRLARVRLLEGAIEVDVAGLRARLRGDSPADLRAFQSTLEAEIALRQERKLDALDSLLAARLASGETGDAVGLLLLEGILGNVQHDLGMVGEARVRYGAAVRLARQLQSPTLLGIWLLYRGLAELEEGESGRAARTLAESVRVSREVGQLRFMAHGEGALALASPRADSQLRLARALACLQDTGDRHRAQAVSIFAHGIDVRLAPSSDIRARRVALVRAVQALAGVLTPTDDIRTAVRIVAGCLAEAHESLARADADTPVAVHPLGLALRSGDHVADLAAHPSNARVLACLLRAHLDGRPASEDELIRAGWPAEKMLREAGRRRLQVAISWLRGQGLGDTLVRHADGYVLSGVVGLAGRGADASGNVGNTCSARGRERV